MVFTYIFFSPEIDVHPHIKKSLIDETHSIAQRITASLNNPSAKLEEVMRQIHETEEANMRVYDTRGNQIATYVEHKLRGIEKISPTIIEDTLRQDEHLDLIFPRWIHVVSVPLKGKGQTDRILQVYYPLMKSNIILPRGVPTTYSSHYHWWTNGNIFTLSDKAHKGINRGSAADVCRKSGGSGSHSLPR